VEEGANDNSTSLRETGSAALSRLSSRSAHTGKDGCEDAAGQGSACDRAGAYAAIFAAGQALTARYTTSQNAKPIRRPRYCG
jgi:hypothetical protein